MKPSQNIAPSDELEAFAEVELVREALGGWQHDEEGGGLVRFRAACDSFFGQLDPLEIGIVRLLLARRPATVASARMFDEAGKGLLYPVLAAAAILVDGADAFLTILACAVATAISLALYPVIKQLVRRERPCAFDQELEVGVAPLDRYAWPSGHSITAVAFFVPFAVAGSALLPLIAPLVLLVLWSRIALGHHYPTDVIGGASLGAGIAWASALALGI